MKRVKELEHENGRLKRMSADQSLENAVLKDVIAKKLSGLLRGGRSSRTWSLRAAFRFSGPVPWRARLGDVLPAPRRLGSTGCAGHRGPHASGHGEKSLGLLEVL